ncbi:pimeloyl-ACP methyl ester carboxylesterase [Saccharothrix saharensis]|uniref:Pimeloyl-ACP methyl ester carboxylesterase n=1 Tax=Saccharothrix saharensis TaxID=571190 RepID=A0A543JLF3_9PSEU|nr:alpha/beta hydrolase [Saccharothrix saharensis]TQM83680.1 pimeloyl-ACP methyl ester carboxylesterase [Saccharothrix saharensis]
MIEVMEDVPARTVTLPDGRRLAYYEFGDPAGVPCLYTPGWPASGLLGGVYDDAAREAGVRWISIDKPGAGASDFDPRRSLLRYADDIAHLADELGLDRFASVGESGGGPHAAVLAHALPDRLTTTILLAAMGPAHEKWVREGMQPVNRRLIMMAQRAPWLLRAQTLLLSRMMNNPTKARRWERSLVEQASEADRRALARIDTGWLTAAAAAALRDGGRAAAQELAMIARPWGFALADITSPVEVWHGTADTNVPVAIARRVVAEIRTCTAVTYVEGEGHIVGLLVRHDVMASVVRASGGGRRGDMRPPSDRSRPTGHPRS